MTSSAERAASTALAALGGFFAIDWHDGDPDDGDSCVGDSCVGDPCDGNGYDGAGAGSSSGRQAPGRGESCPGSGTAPDAGSDAGSGADLDAASAGPAPAWRPMAELIDDGGAEDGALARRVAAVRAALGASGGRDPADIPERVAVSVTQLGLVARVAAVAVGTEALGMPPLDLSPSGLWWRDALGGPFPLAVRWAGASTVAEGGPAEGRRLPGRFVEALTERCADRYAVSPQVLWGNVGSAANSAARLVAAARPECAESAWAAADLVLADPRVDGGITRSGPEYRRRSCCLMYRLSPDGAPVCGDCVLHDGGR